MTDKTITLELTEDEVRAMTSLLFNRVNEVQKRIDSGTIDPDDRIWATRTLETLKSIRGKWNKARWGKSPQTAENAA